MHLLGLNFSKILFLLPPEISCTFLLEICISCEKWPKIALFSDFIGHPVEISEVLPVEISGVRSKKIMSFGPTLHFFPKFVPP